jgi:hypothetical protein
MASLQKSNKKEAKLLRALLKNKSLNFDVGDQKEEDILDFLEQNYNWSRVVNMMVGSDNIFRDRFGEVGFGRGANVKIANYIFNDKETEFFKNVIEYIKKSLKKEKPKVKPKLIKPLDLLPEIKEEDFISSQEITPISNRDFYAEESRLATIAPEQKVMERQSFIQSPDSRDIYELEERQTPFIDNEINTKYVQRLKRKINQNEQKLKKVRIDIFNYMRKKSDLSKNRIKRLEKEKDRLNDRIRQSEGAIDAILIIMEQEAEEKRDDILMAEIREIELQNESRRLKRIEEERVSNERKKRITNQEEFELQNREERLQRGIQKQKENDKKIRDEYVKDRKIKKRQRLIESRLSKERITDLRELKEEEEKSATINLANSLRESASGIGGPVVPVSPPARLTDLKPFKFPDFSKKANKKINDEIAKVNIPENQFKEVGKAIENIMKTKNRLTVKAIITGITAVIAFFKLTPVASSIRQTQDSSNSGKKPSASSPRKSGRLSDLQGDSPPSKRPTTNTPVASSIQQKAKSKIISNLNWLLFQILRDYGIPAGYAAAKATMLNDMMNRLKKAINTGKIFKPTAEETEEFTKMVLNFNLENLSKTEQDKIKSMVTQSEWGQPPEFSYMGAGTNVESRIKGNFKSSLPSSKIDMLAMKHDMYYMLKDPKARQRADGIFINDLISIIFTTSDMASRGGALGMLTLFTLKKALEKAGARFSEDLSGGNEYLGTVTEKQFKAIDDEWKRFGQIADSAGYIFTANDRKIRPTAAGITPDVKKSYAEFRNNIEFLFEPQFAKGEQKEITKSVLFDFGDNKNLAYINMGVDRKAQNTTIINSIINGTKPLTRGVINQLYQNKVTNGQLIDLSNSLGYRKLKSKATKEQIINHITKNIKDPKVDESQFAEGEQGEQSEPKDFSATTSKTSPTIQIPSTSPSSPSANNASPTMEKVMATLSNLFSVKPVGKSQQQNKQEKSSTKDEQQNQNQNKQESKQEQKNEEQSEGSQSTSKPRKSSGLATEESGDFDALGYSITNPDSKAAVDEIMPSVTEQKDSNISNAMAGLVTSSLWRPKSSSMNEDRILRHMIEFGGSLQNGIHKNIKKKTNYKGTPIQMRPVLYNRNFYIPREPRTSPNPLTEINTMINPPQINTLLNRKYNPEQAPWRNPRTARVLV